MIEPARNVFVSYTSVDAVVARRLADELRIGERYVWCAESDFVAGQDFDAIFHAIDSADAFVPVLSPDALASPWVAKEVRVAVTRQLGYRPLLILPVYVQPCEPPPALRDLKGVALSTDSWQAGLVDLIGALDCRSERPQPLTLEDVVKDRIVVPDEVARILRLSVRLSDVDTVIVRLTEDDAFATLPEGDRERLLQDVRAGRRVPALTAGERAELIRFSRGTDERLKRFAVALMSVRKHHPRGITLETAHEEIGTLLSAEFSLRDPDMRRWRAEALVREAMAAGLLLRSREMWDPGFDVGTYLANPSFDYGPLVPLVGPLVEEWLNRRGLGTEPEIQ